MTIEVAIIFAAIILGVWIYAAACVHSKQVSPLFGFLAIVALLVSLVIGMTEGLQ